MPTSFHINLKMISLDLSIDSLLIESNFIRIKKKVCHTPRFSTSLLRYFDKLNMTIKAYNGSLIVSHKLYLVKYVLIQWRISA